MVDSTAVGAVRSAVTAFNNGDIDGYLGYFDPSCQRWIAGLAQPLSVTDIGESLRQLRTPFGDLRLDADALFGDERFVCVRWRLRSAHLPDLNGQLLPDEPPIDIETCEVYEIGAELIVNTWGYGHMSYVSPLMTKEEDVP